MPGEAYQVHDEVMAVVKATNAACSAIQHLSSAWGDVERQRYLEENLTKIRLALGGIGAAESMLRDLYNKVNRAATAQREAPPQPVLRVVS